MTAPPPTPLPKPAWWETRWFAGAMVLLAIVPLLLPSIPPLTDLMGHMGRYRVQLDIAGSPWLGRYYSFDWAVIGNLGCDLLVQLLGPLLGLEPAVKLIVLTIPALTVAGLIAVAREVHGRVPATALFALPLAYGYPFQFGFINFALAMGLMLVLFALWLRMARTGGLRWRPAVFLIAGFALWVAHSFAWGVLGILCFIAEGVRRRKQGERWHACIGHAILACLPLAPPALLLLPWPGRPGATPHGSFDFFNWTFKTRWIVSVLRERIEYWDKAGALLLYAVALSGLVRRPWRRYEAVLGIAAVLLLAIFMALPRVLLGSAYADMRLMPYVLALAILALRPIADRRVASGLAIAATLFFAGRIAVSTAAFLRYERNYEAQLKALDQVPMGARVMVLASIPCRTVWYTTRMEHLSSMATVRRQSFVNDQWVAPGAQLLRIRYRYPGRAFRYYSHDPSELLRRPDCRARNEPVLEQALAHFPRGAYDYLWMIDMPREQWPRDPGLRRVWEGRRFGILYRITANQDGSAIASSDTPNGALPRVTQ